jgi:C-terminal processing protease CtpA/Prc
VFAGALQETGRAIIVGHTSYGGVLNSTTLELPTGGMLQYPHSDMRTPKGRRIEGCGVVPDVVVDLRRGSATFRKWFSLELAAQDEMVADPAKQFSLASALYIADGIAYMVTRPRRTASTVVP